MIKVSGICASVLVLHVNTSWQRMLTVSQEAEVVAKEEDHEEDRERNVDLEGRRLPSLRTQATLLCATHCAKCVGMPAPHTSFS